MSNDALNWLCNMATWDRGAENEIKGALLAIADFRKWSKDAKIHEPDMTLIAEPLAAEVLAQLDKWAVDRYTELGIGETPKLLEPAHFYKALAVVGEGLVIRLASSQAQDSMQNEGNQEALNF